MNGIKEFSVLVYGNPKLSRIEMLNIPNGCLAMLIPRAILKFGGIPSNTYTLLNLKCWCSACFYLGLSVHVFLYQSMNKYVFAR